MDLKYTGFEELTSKLQQLGAQGKEIENAAVDKGAEHLEKKFKAAVYAHGLKEKSGTGRESITHETKEGKALIGPSTDGFYLYFWEIGFNHVGSAPRGKGRASTWQPARPWMQPTFTRERGSTQDVMGDEVKKRLGL
jgi:HK97 gp10 family phage protein